MDLSKTAQRAVAAYGGEARWRDAAAVEVCLSAWGWAFRLKWRRAFRRAHARLAVHEPWARMSPIDRHGNVGILDGSAVRVEHADGAVLAARAEPRSAFPYGRRALYWDRLDHTYFATYALWNYVTLPALLLREDIDWVELEDGVLEASFPAYIPTHCRVQRFHFDTDTGLLRQHDYTAEVFGGWAKAAHVVVAHAEAEGVPYTAQRRVTPRRRDGTPARAPLLVGIEIHEWALVAREPAG